MLILILGYFSKGVVTCSHDLWRLLLPHLFQRCSHTPLFWRNCFDSKTTFNWPFIFQCRICLCYIARQAACREIQFLSQDSVLVDVHLCLISAKDTHSASVLEFLDWCGEGGESLFYVVLYLQTKWWFWTHENTFGKESSFMYDDVWWCPKEEFNPSRTQVPGSSRLCCSESLLLPVCSVPQFSCL